MECPRVDEERPPHFHDLSSSSSESEDSASGATPGVKRLHRSSDQRILLGVCGGLGEYFDLDPNLVRAIFAVLTIFAGGGILLYVVLAIIMPAEDKLDVHPREAARATVDEAVAGTRQAAEKAGDWARAKSPWTASKSEQPEDQG